MKPLDKARAMLAEVDRRIDEWRVRADGLNAALGEAQRNQGSAVLESGSPGAVATEIARLRGEAEAASAAVFAAQAGREQAVIAVLLFEAEDLDRQAVEAAALADKHDAKRCELMAALERHEGFGGDPGTGYGPRQVNQGSGVGWLPKSVALRNESESLRGRATGKRREAYELRPTIFDRVDELKTAGLTETAAWDRAERELLGVAA